MTIPATPTPRLRASSRSVPFAAGRTILALILREMTTTYGRKVGGYLWTILEPVLGITVLVAIFSAGFRHPPLGVNFPIFYASGMLPFAMYTAVYSRISTAVMFSRQLLNYPRVSYIDAILARLVLTVLTQALVSIILFTGIMLLFDTRTALDLGELVLAFAIMASVGLGMGLLNCPLLMKFPIWGSVWGILSRPMILASNVIFLIDRIPEPYFTWLTWNPLVHGTGLARRALYYSYDASYVDVAYPFLFALVTGTTGLLFIRRYYRDFFEL